MNVEVIRLEETNATLQEKWAEIIFNNESLCSPYFNFNYFKAVNDVCGNVYIGIIEIENKIAGFFPFQKNKNSGCVVGFGMSDYQGLIINKNSSFSLKKLIKYSRICEWKYDQLISEQKIFLKYSNGIEIAPIINLNNGLANYFNYLKASDSTFFKDVNRKFKKLTHDYEKIQFCWKSSNYSDFKKLIALKHEQYYRTKSYNQILKNWEYELLDRIFNINSRDFAGILSTIHIDSELIAAHFGMKTERTWHFWYPVYNIKFSQYSPGHILLLEVIKNCSNVGINQIHLGKGLYRFKRSVMNDYDLLLRGCVSSNFS